MLDYTAPKTDREYYAGRRYISLNDVTAQVTGPPGLGSVEYSDSMGNLGLWGLGQPMDDYSVSLPFEDSIPPCCDSYECQDAPNVSLCPEYEKCYMPGDGKEGKEGYERPCNEEDGAVMTFSRPMPELRWELGALLALLVAIGVVVLVRHLRAK